MSDLLSRVNKTIERISQFDPRENVGKTILGGLVVSAVTFGMLFLIDVHRHSRSTQPLQYRPVDSSKLSKDKELRKNPLKDRFIPGKTKIPEDIDYIVIGSGPGGLSCAAALSRVGKKVLVLEQHDRLGGGMHTYNKKFGFDVGVHYIGNVKKFGDRVLNTLCLPGRGVKWVLLGNEENGYAYDRFVFGTGKDAIIDYARAMRRFKDIEASLQTPEDKKAFKEYVRVNNRALMLFDIVMATRLFMSDTVGRISFGLCKWIFSDLWNKTAKEVFSQVFTDKQAKIAWNLSANIGDAGGMCSDNPFALVALINKHYDTEGGYYPVGGPNAIISEFVTTIENSGGRCLASASVARIIFENNRAVGVIVTKNHKEFEIRCSGGVVSACGIRNTYMKLAPLNELPSSTPKQFINNVNRLFKEVPPSAQHFQVFIGFNKSPEELKLPTYNTWYYSSNVNEKTITLNSMDECISAYHKDPLNAPPFAFIGFPSSKDPTYSSRHPGKSVCEIATEIPMYHFEKYATLPSGGRGEEYEEFKKKIGMRLVKMVTDMWPQLENCIETIEYGSALTSVHYFGAVHGESYGLHHSLERFYDLDISRCLRSRQPIDGLYLTGQDTSIVGFVGGMVSGIQAAESILGYHKWPILLAKRSLIRDLKKMDGLPVSDEDLIP